MANVSIVSSQNFMVDRLISKVRFSISRSRYENYTDNLHHGISADALTRKFGIGIYK